MSEDGHSEPGSGCTLIAGSRERGRRGRTLPRKVRRATVRTMRVRRGPTRWSSTAARRRWPCASSADERTRDEGPWLPGPLVLAFLIAPGDRGCNFTKASGQHHVVVRVTSVRSLADGAWLNSSLTLQGRAGALVEASKPGRGS